METTLTNARIFTGTHWLTPGFITFENGVITDLGSSSLKEGIDLDGKIVMPGIIDCHTHLLEFATLGIKNARGLAQRQAGFANLFCALEAGITTLGEHILGHPILNQPLEIYQEIACTATQDISLCPGWCALGTDPITLLSSTSPGSTVTKEDLLNEENLDWIIGHSQFPGENIFITATVANLPPALVPKGGETIIETGEIRTIINRFHSRGKRIGAHLEGDEAIRNFINLGGDVVHHGHGIQKDTLKLMAKTKTQWVITPHGGTSATPTSPELIAQALDLGLKPALASDSYLPVHPDASYLGQGLSPEVEIGPKEFMVVVHNLYNQLRPLGVSKEEVIRMLTINPAEIMVLANLGSIQPGAQADLLILPELWGVDLTDWTHIHSVLKSGELVLGNL